MNVQDHPQPFVARPLRDQLAMLLMREPSERENVVACEGVAGVGRRPRPTGPQTAVDIRRRGQGFGRLRSPSRSELALFPVQRRMHQAPEL